MPTDRILLRGSPSFRDSCSAWMRRQFPRCSTFRARATKSLGSTCAALGGDPPDLKRHHPTGNISRRAGQLGQHPHWPILRCVRSPPDSIEQDLLEIGLCRQFCRKAHGGDSRTRAAQPADRASWRSTLPFGPSFFFIPMEIVIRSGRSRSEVFSLRAATSAPLRIFDERARTASISANSCQQIVLTSSCPWLQPGWCPPLPGFLSRRSGRAARPGQGQKNRRG